MISQRDLHLPTLWVKRSIVESPREPYGYNDRCLFDCFLRNEAPFSAQLYLDADILNDDDRSELIACRLAGISWGRYAHVRVVYVDHGITNSMKDGIMDSLYNGPPIIFRSLKNGTYWLNSGWKIFCRREKPKKSFFMIESMI